MDHSDSSNRNIKAVGRALNLVETIQELDGATFTELSEHVDIAESTLYDYLTTLDNLGYLSNEEGQYDLTLRFLDRGIYVRNRFPVLSKSRSTLKQVAEDSGQAAWLVVEEEGKAVYLAQELGKQSIETHERLGKHEYMHCLASGKAMLAFSPEEHVQQVIDNHGLPKKTPKSISTAEELMSQLANIREQEYAINEHETAEGVSAVAAPIVANDQVHGAIAIATPVARLRNDAHRQQMIELVTTASNEIELKLTYG